MAKKTTDAPVGISSPSEASERKWQAEEALRTISRAEDHKSDKKLMADVASHASSQAEKMSRIAGMVGRGSVSQKAMKKVGRKMNPNPKENVS